MLRTQEDLEITNKKHQQAEYHYSPIIRKVLEIFGMSAVQRVSLARSASSGEDNGLYESDFPSTAFGAPCDDLMDAGGMISRLLEATRAQHVEELRAERRCADKACKGLHRKIRVLTASMRQRQQDDQGRSEVAETKVAEQSARIIFHQRRLAARDDKNAALRIHVENLLTAVKETGAMRSVAANFQG